MISRYRHLFWFRGWNVSVGYDIRDLWLGAYWDWSKGEPFCGHRYLDIYIVLIPAFLVLRLEIKFDGLTRWMLTLDGLFDKREVLDG